MLAEEFKKQFTCLGENNEKCINFALPIDNEITRINRIIELKKMEKKFNLRI